MAKAKKNKTKHPAFKANLNGQLLVVRARGPEQAAMKVFRTNKAAFAERGCVEVTDEERNCYRFATSNWCSEGNPRKFLSKPKK